MTKDRWERVKELFHAATERPPGARAAFLAAETGDDSSLRQEVESMLAMDADEGDVLDRFSFRPASLSLDALMSGDAVQPAARPLLDAGHRIGSYEIVELLGAGAMGEVYRARDTKLTREVALKVISSSLAANPDRLARFRREAKLLAALNHPNIGAIHGVEETADRPALVLELIEGPTLAARIAHGKLSLTESLRVARQIAEGLEAAHGQGIIHRDLKPANIHVRSDGLVKILDFGLAKSLAVDAGKGGDPGARKPGSTREGIILGTAGYMSPEQARGTAVDTRGDIWAFGCVLFEMLAGRPGFGGETSTDVLAAVVTAEPEWSALPPDLPPGVRTLLRRCLNKDSRSRLQAIGDARIELDEIASSGERAGSAIQAGAGENRAWRRWLPWMVAGAATLVAVALTQRSAVRPASFDRQIRFELNLPPQVEVSTIAAPNAAVSPDGTKVVFTGQEVGLRRLYVRDLDSTTIRVLPSTETASQCYFSPDGSAVTYIAADRTLRRVSLTDGLSVVMARGVDRNFGASWGVDGMVTFVAGGTLHQVPDSGGDARQLTTLDRGRGELYHAWPTNVPGTSLVLFTAASGGTRDTHRIDAIDPRSGERRNVVANGSFPMLAADGPLVFMREGALVAAPFDRAGLVLTGPAIKVADDVALDPLGAPLAALSPTGALIYSSRSSTAKQLVTVARSGLAAPLADARAYDFPRLSPDGRRITTFVSGDIWQLDTARSVMTRVTAEAAVGNSYAVWLPDGKRVVFRTATGLRIGASDGSGGSVPIPGTAVTDFPNAVTADGKSLVFTRQTADASADIYVLSLEGEPRPHALFSTAAYEGGGVLSPDNRWLAYASNESGHFEVFVRPFPDGGRKWAASTEGGTQPMWSRDGKELYYRQGSRMFAVPVVSRPDFTLGHPTALFDGDFAYGGITYAEYDVMPDGRFVMIERASGSGHFNVVLNWGGELKRLIDNKGP